MMNTKTVTMMDLVFSGSDRNFPVHEPSRKSAVTLEIANRAIVALEARGRMKAGEIAEAIGAAGINWRGERVNVTAQSVGCVMRKLINIGRVKREEVEGEPMEVTISPRPKWDWVTGSFIYQEPYQKTITPKINYYRLV